MIARFKSSNKHLAFQFQASRKRFNKTSLETTLNLQTHHELWTMDFQWTSKGALRFEAHNVGRILKENKKVRCILKHKLRCGFLNFLMTWKNIVDNWCSRCYLEQDYAKVSFKKLSPQEPWLKTLKHTNRFLFGKQNVI